MKSKIKLNTNTEQNINKLLQILVCPKTGGKLTYNKNVQYVLLCVTQKQIVIIPYVNHV